MASLTLLAIATIIITGASAAQQVNFTNPILNRHTQSTTVLHLNGHYYLPHVYSAGRLDIYKSELLTDFENGTRKTIVPWPDRSPSKQVSSLQLVDGELFLYFSATVWQTQSASWKWSMHGMKAQDSSDPMGEWDPPVPMLTDWEPAVTDGNVMKHGGQNYFLWGSNTTTGNWSIFISRMSTPTETTGPVVMIKEPTEDWECCNICSNYLPTFLYRDNVTYMIFSASSSPTYFLSQMSIPSEKDPMEPTNWEYVGGPVFQSNEEETVFNPVYASFTDSPDGTETWMVYVARLTPGSYLWTVRLERIEWNLDGTPRFPLAHGFDHPQPVPSGQTGGA